MFSPEQFLDQQYTEANSTAAIPVPAGEFIGIIDKTEIKQWASKDGSKAGVKLLVFYSLDDASVKELLGRDKVSVRQDVMLDTLDSGGLDMGRGRNVGLGKLREACDLNTPGQPFAFSLLPGKVLRVTVTHRIDGDNIYVEVKAVARV